MFEGSMFEFLSISPYATACSNVVNAAFAGLVVALGVGAVVAGLVVALGVVTVGVAVAIGAVVRGVDVPIGVGEGVEI